MRVTLVLALAVATALAVVVHGSDEPAGDLSHGWGAGIDWLSLDEARKLAPLDSKPIMLVIHKSWCGACKALRPKFAESEEIKSLSAHFLMVNTEDDEEPAGDEYKPDGGYIPRILFLAADGTVQPQVINEGGNAKYQYYYPSTDAIVATMRRIVDKGIPKPKVEL